MEADNPFLDRNSEIIIKEGGNLPHWHQNGKIQFVTFRLADSLPQVEIERLKDLKERFEGNHPQPWDNETLFQFRRLVGPMEERLLDAGYGECVLRHESVRKVIVESLNYGNGINYNLLAYVIMPNHVHLLIQPLGNINLETILHSIKSFTARSINRLLGRQGQLWMKGSYDRIVRSAEHLKHYYNYIRHNPAHLTSDMYTLYI